MTLQTCCKNLSHEFTESQHKVNRENNGMSQKDLKFMQVLHNGTRFNDGHYKIPLQLMIMSDSQITDYKLRNDLHICKERCQGTLKNSRITI